MARRFQQPNKLKASKNKKSNLKMLQPNQQQRLEQLRLPQENLQESVFMGIENASAFLENFFFLGVYALLTLLLYGGVLLLVTYSGFWKFLWRLRERLASTWEDFIPAPFSEAIQLVIPREGLPEAVGDNLHQNGKGNLREMPAALTFYLYSPATRKQLCFLASLVQKIIVAQSTYRKASTYLLDESEVRIQIDIETKAALSKEEQELFSKASMFAHRNKWKTAFGAGFQEGAKVLHRIEFSKEDGYSLERLNHQRAKKDQELEKERAAMFQKQKPQSKKQRKKNR